MRNAIAARAYPGREVQERSSPAVTRQPVDQDARRRFGQASIQFPSVTDATHASPRQPAGKILFQILFLVQLTLILVVMTYLKVLKKAVHSFLTHLGQKKKLSLT